MTSLSIYMHNTYMSKCNCNIGCLQISRYLTHVHKYGHDKSVTAEAHRNNIYNIVGYFFLSITCNFFKQICFKRYIYTILTTQKICQVCYFVNKSTVFKLDALADI